MTVTLHLRRVAPATAGTRSGGRLLRLFRIGREERGDLWAAGELTSLYFHPAVVDAVVVACTPGGGAEARLPVFGGEDRTATGVDGDGAAVTYTAVAVLAPALVARAAAVLEAAPYGTWLPDNHARMRETTARLGFVTPWDDDWAARILHDLEDLQDFYRAAADRGDAVVKYLDC